jgi:hypothetical protein
MVAFFQEGSVWGERRELINKKNQIEATEPAAISPIERIETPQAQPEVRGENQ